MVTASLVVLEACIVFMNVLALTLALDDKVLAVALALRKRPRPRFFLQHSGHVIVVGLYVYAMLTLTTCHMTVCHFLFRNVSQTRM